MNRRGFFQRLIGAATAATVAPKVLESVTVPEVGPMPTAMIVNPFLSVIGSTTTINYGLSFEMTQELLGDNQAQELLFQRRASRLAHDVQRRSYRVKTS